jgi:hypothetical protein
MPDINQKQIFSPDADMSRYAIQPLPPLPKDTRGFIYLVQCSRFRDYVKIGKTRDMVKRLAAYNQDRPVKSVSPLYISGAFDDVDLVEKRILDFMYRNHCTAGSSHEWFENKHLDKLKELIQEAEDYFMQPVKDWIDEKR